VPFSNQYGYNDPEMNALIAKAAGTVDAGERSRVYRDFQKRAGELQPIIHVAEFTFISVARDRLRNVANNPRWATSNWADAWLAS
jgi:peptide/nickel transport system substrate-binding protein